MFAPLHTSESKTHATQAQDTPVPFFQPKLTVNTPGDAHEQQADQVADQVMRMHQGDTPIVQRMSMTPTSRIMRKCAGTKCEKEENEGVQRKESGGDTGGKSAPPIVGDVLSSGGGQPMDGGTKQFMESRFGQDFSQVRIHTDSQAAESAAAIQARAYTSGRDVVFGAGEYRPESESGKRLLAHELVHVGQQGKNNQIKRQAAPVRHPMEARFNGNFDQGINAVVDMYDLLREQIHQGCEDWYVMAKSSDQTSTILQDLLLATVSIAVGSITGGIGTVILASAGAAATRFALNAALDAGKGVVSSSVSSAMSWAMSDPVASKDQMRAHYRTTQTAYAKVNGEQKRELRAQLTHKTGDSNKWEILQSMLDSLQALYDRQIIRRESQIRCLDAWFAGQAQAKYGSQKDDTTNELTMSSQLQNSSLSNSVGTIVIRLNEMMGPDAEPYPMIVDYPSGQGSNSQVRSVLSDRVISDIYMPKIVYRDGYLDGSYFKIFFDEKNKPVSVSYSGSSGFWDGGQYSPNKDFITDTMEPSEILTNTNAGRSWLAARGLYQFPASDPNTPLDTKVMWGMISIGIMLSTYTPSGNKR